jgi:excisionase family DNA binding protein
VPELSRIFLRTREAAQVLGLSVRSLEKMRAEQRGPAYRRFGGRVLYDADALRAWAERLPGAPSHEPPPLRPAA